MPFGNPPDTSPRLGLSRTRNSWNSTRRARVSTICGVNNMIRLACLLAVVVFIAYPHSSALAQGVPIAKPYYRELSQRGDLKFRMDGVDRIAAIGLMNWDFPLSTPATVGLNSNLASFCLEPLLPINAGNEYSFQVDTFGKAKDFNLKDDDEGRKDAERRTKFVRELYGRCYADVLSDPHVAAPAFQLALWEVMLETVASDGPTQYSLDTGSFRTNFPKTDAAPPYVAQAQKYLQSLTGDDTVFSETPALAGQELVRLTGLLNTSGVRAQSQLALRNSGGVLNSGAGSSGLGLVGMAVGGGFGRPTLTSGGSPLGGSGGGFGGIGRTTSLTGLGGLSSQSGITTSTETFPPSGLSPIQFKLIPIPTSEITPLPNPISTSNPTAVPTPAPPGLVLGLIGASLFGIWHYRHARIRI